MPRLFRQHCLLFKLSFCFSFYYVFIFTLLFISSLSFQVFVLLDVDPLCLGVGSRSSGSLHFYYWIFDFFCVFNFFRVYQGVALLSGGFCHGQRNSSNYLIFIHVFFSFTYGFTSGLPQFYDALCPIEGQRCALTMYWLISLKFGTVRGATLHVSPH